MAIYDETLDLQLPEDPLRNDGSPIELHREFARIYHALKMLNINKRGVFQFSSGLTTQAISLTRYVGSASLDTSAALVEFQVPFDCIVRGLYVSAGAAIAAGSITYTLMVNGAAPAGGPAVTLTASASRGAATTAQVQLYAGDRLSMRVVTSGTATVTTHKATLAF